MKTVSLSGFPRESVGKKDAKKQRREGMVPCVLYGEEGQVHFTMKELEFDRLIFTPDVYLVNLNIDGTEYNTILQDVQYHPVTDKVLHADFLKIFPGKQIIIKLPVRFVGNVPGVIAGGRLIKNLRKLLVKGDALDMPDFIEIDMSNLNIGDNINVKDVSVDKLKFLDLPNEVVVGVKTARGIEEEEEEEEEEGEEGEGAEGAEGDEGGKGGETKPTKE